MYKTDVVDRALRNMTYMLIVTEEHLGPWASKHHLNQGNDSLVFVTQMESDHLRDVHLSLEYSNKDETKVVAAGYVGQKLSDKEKEYTKTLKRITNTSITRKPIFDVIMTTMTKVKKAPELKIIIAQAIQNLVIELVAIGNGVEASLGTSNGSVILFIKEATGSLVKIELYLKDMVDFIDEIESIRLTNLRDTVKSIINQRARA